MILEIIIAGFFLATIFNIILNKLNMPTIIGYIFTWTLLSYIFWLHTTVSNESLKIIAEFWIVFLMFTIWLEFSVKTLFKMKKYVFVYWLLQFVITSIFFYLIWFYIFWLDYITSLIISFWLTLSSTAIVLKTLSESWEIKKDYWQKSAWILIFQDLAVIPILLFITIVSVKTANIWELLLLTALKAVILFLWLWLIWKYLLSSLLYNVSKTKSNEIFIWFILFIIIWISYLSHLMWFSYSLWAFIAGLMIAETYYKHKVEADLIPFRDLFLGFFFITIWMQLKFDIILDNLSIIFLLLGILIFIKIIVIFFILKFWNNKKVSLKTALTLFQFWEFGLVIFDLAISKQLLNTELWQVLIVIIIISMIITPLILKNIDFIVEQFFWKQVWKQECKKIDNQNEFKNHTILIWYWRLWKVISSFLDKQKIKYIILEKYEKPFKDWKKDWKKIIFWNATNQNFLRSIKIDKAKNIIISVWKSEKLYLIVDIIKKISPDSNIIIKVNFENEKELIKKLNVKHIIVEAEKTAHSIIKFLKK